MVNWAEADFNSILKGGSEACFNVIKSEGEKHGLTIATFNPLSCFGKVDDLVPLTLPSLPPLHPLSLVFTHSPFVSTLSP